MLRRKLAQLTNSILCAVVSSLLLTAAVQAGAQNLAAADGPGSYIQVGGSGSIYQIDYGQRDLGGGAVFIDANLYRTIGVEAEARTLRINEDAGAHETTYLVGPRISLKMNRFRPYGKLLIGRGQFYYPFHYAQGSYFVVAPGAGVDWQVAKRLTVRVIDVEFQNWPWFSFGPLKPYGISSGIAFRVF
jgi:hypothetical protein